MLGEDDDARDTSRPPACPARPMRCSPRAHRARRLSTSITSSTASMSMPSSSAARGDDARAGFPAASDFFDLLALPSWARLPWCARTRSSLGQLVQAMVREPFAEAPGCSRTEIVLRCARISLEELRHRSQATGLVVGRGICPRPTARTGTSRSLSITPSADFGARHVRNRDARLRDRGSARSAGVQDLDRVDRRPGSAPPRFESVARLPRVPRAAGPGLRRETRDDVRERACQVRTALRGRKRMDLVDQHRLDLAQRLPLPGSPGGDRATPES